MLGGCAQNPADGGQRLPDFAVVDGAMIRAAAAGSADSVAVRVEFTAADAPSTVKLGPCPVTLLAYVDTPRVGSSPIWSEAQQDPRVCPGVEAWVELGPREAKTVTHVVVRRRPYQGAPLPARPRYFAITLTVASGDTVTIRTQ